MLQAKEVNYVGDNDVTVWLEEINEGPPVIVPLWPKDFPRVVPVGITIDEGDLIVPFSRQAMLSLFHPQRLWFCRVPGADLLSNTDAEASWLKKE